MTLLDMQRVLSRILTDKSFQQAFILGDEPRPATYQLSERELGSLRGLNWDRVGLHSDLLAHSRLELALKALPLTSLLLHQQLHGQLDRFCADYPPIPLPASQLYLEATRLCDFAIQLIGEGALRPGWAADVVAYERILLRLVHSDEAAASGALVAELNKATLPLVPDWPPVNPCDVVPVAGPHIMIASFSYPLPDVLPMLDNGEIPASVQPLERPLFLLFHKQPRVPVAIIKVNVPTVTLVDACDGHRTVAAVAARLSRQFGSGTGQQAVAALGWLRDSGVIGLRKRP